VNRCREHFRFEIPEDWGVVQLVGHLTVNEDGVGSSPTAPANLLRSCGRMVCRNLWLRDEWRTSVMVCPSYF
jgi:hypothetical protein